MFLINVNLRRPLGKYSIFIVAFDEWRRGVGRRKGGGWGIVPVCVFYRFHVCVVIMPTVFVRDTAASSY